MRQSPFFVAALAALLLAPPALAQAPTPLEAADALNQAGRRREALAAYLKAADMADSPESRTLALEKAVQTSRLLNERDRTYEIARQIPLEPDGSVAQLFALSIFGRHAELVERFGDRAFGDWPALPAGRAYAYRGAAHARLGNGPAAEADLAQALDRLTTGSDAANAAFARALNFRDTLRDEARAIAAFSAAAEIARGVDRWGQTFMDAVVFEAELHSRQGRHDAALQALAKVDMNTLQTWRRAHMLRGYAEAYATAGDLPRAIETYNTILETPELTATQKQQTEQRLNELMASLSDPTAGSKDVILAAAGQSGYQIVIPDTAPDADIDAWYVKCAELIRQAFATNGFALPVARESARDPARPGLYLGATVFARDNGLDLASLPDWSYRFKAVGRDLVIAGHDAPTPLTLDPDRSGKHITGRPRLGTVRAVTAFLHAYARTRFIDPGPRGIQFLTAPVIAVPADLDRTFSPAVKYNYSWFHYERFYDFANNYLLPYDLALGAHTFPAAVPVEKYRDTNPEYFAEFGGQRCGHAEGHAAEQYCISNPGFQELVYRFLLGQVDSGYNHVSLGQSDGFRGCQCDACRDLYDTSDWTEKLWFFNRDLAERLLRDRPHATIILVSYGPTFSPPVAFREFPANTMVMLCRMTPELMEEWARCTVPRGYVGYIYLWGSTYNALGYTPKQTPDKIGEFVRHLHRIGVQGVFIDGFGSSFGLEGPAYYVYGRIWDDPAGLQVKDLLEEYYEGAFVNAAVPMSRFFGTLYHAVRINDDLPKSYQDAYGRTRRHFEYDPMRLMSILYSPDMLVELDQHLKQAEALATAEAVRARIALVRLEFDYLRHIATVAHLHEAYKLAPTLTMRDILLDAVDAWNAFLDPLFDERGNMKGAVSHLAVWPFSGHARHHVGLTMNVAGKAYADTPLNWDTAAMRRAPLPGAATLTAIPAEDSADWNSPAWGKSPAVAWSAGPDDRARTTVRAIFDAGSLRLLIECTGADVAGSLVPLPDMDAVDRQESVQVVLDATGAREKFHRFIVEPTGKTRFAGATGFITDPVHPLYGKEDRSWQGDWAYAVQRDADHGSWRALVTIPYAALEMQAASVGALWRGNVARTWAPTGGEAMQTLWSGGDAARGVTDRDAFGEIRFSAAEDAASKHPVQAMRERLYATTFEIPEAWRALENPLPKPLGPWLFRIDPARQGETLGWQRAGLDTALWSPIPVSAFWAETGVGDYIGLAWYRVEFEVPEAWRGKSLRLLFGGVDEEAVVYVNGHKLEEHTSAATGLDAGQLWESPFEVDVPPEQLVYGGRNLLAVQVNNEIGHAGIWRPVLAHRADE